MKLSFALPIAMLSFAAMSGMLQIKAISETSGAANGLFSASPPPSAQTALLIK